jgi:heme A synthase
MNKGIKAHFYSSMLYLITVFILLLQNKNVTSEAQYILALGYVLIQIGIGILCYLEDWYFEG